MTLNTLWQDAIEKAVVTSKPTAARAYVPVCRNHFAESLTFIEGEAGAEAMLRLAKELPLSCIGIDTEFCYTCPTVTLPNGKTYDDPCGIKPLLLSLTLVVHAGSPMDHAGAYEFVIDLRQTQTYKAVAQLLELPVTFVGHFLQAEFLCLWAAGLPVPSRIWDTWVTEKVLHLGRHHVKYGVPRAADESSEMTIKANAEQDELLRMDLINTCRRYRVPHAVFALDKDRLRLSFLSHTDDAAFTADQKHYAASDATAAAILYLPQIRAATAADVLDHLKTVEMPWVEVNAKMIWHGVRVDGAARQRLRAACDRVLPRLHAELQAMGVTNHRSNPQLKKYFADAGLLDVFCRGEGHSFGKDRLKDMRHLDDAIGRIYEARKIEALGRDALMNVAMTSSVDGRVHPQHHHLGTASGRQSASLPNVLGLDRTLKPLIIADDGFGIGEVDLSQIEIGIAAAIYGEKQLITMFNRGDVYTSMARRFFADRLDDASRDMDDAAFKQAHGGLRDVMKTCTLGIIYGLTPHGLAPRLKKTVPEAEAILKVFLDMFPTLKEALSETWQAGARRGYAVTATGLRRYRKADGPMSAWEKNWMRNHPVQGSAAAAFKLAGVRLSKLYPQNGAKLILAVHDAYVFEAPIDALGAVAELTRAVMCDAVRQMFPMLRPRAEINISCPTCWNKDGDGQALDRWVAAAGRTSD